MNGLSNCRLLLVSARDWLKPLWPFRMIPKGSKIVNKSVAVPRQYQSGQMDRQGKTGGRGNKLLRNLLVEICWRSLRCNPWACDTYNRLLRGSPSRRKIAIIALARKLVVRCWVMLRDEQDWKNDIQKNVA